MLALGINLSRRVLPYTWLELLHHSEAPLEVPGSHGVLINEILYQIKNSDKTVWVDSTRHYFRWLRFQKMRSTDSESHANPLYSAHAICLKSFNPEMPSSKNRIFVSNNDRHRYLCTCVADPNKNADLFPHGDRGILSDYENYCIELWAM